MPTSVKAAHVPALHGRAALACDHDRMRRRDLLDEAAIAAALADVGWERDGASIVKRVKLPTFRNAVAFVGRVAEVAEHLDHHPDIDIRWRTVTLRSSTHSAGGLTAMDFELAQGVDAVVAPAPPAASFVDANTRERERMRALVARLSDDDLRRPVNDSWTVAGVLGHIAFWDGRILALADKLDRGVPFTASDTEPEDVDWINDATRPLIHAIDPRTAARVALEIAEATDARVAALGTRISAAAASDPDLPLNPLRADHRGEHLDDIERALGRGTAETR